MGAAHETEPSYRNDRSTGSHALSAERPSPYRRDARSLSTSPVGRVSAASRPNRMSSIMFVTSGGCSPENRCSQLWVAIQVVNPVRICDTKVVALSPFCDL